MRNELSTNEEEKTERVKESFWGGRQHALGRHGKLGCKEILPTGTQTLSIMFYSISGISLEDNDLVASKNLYF